MKAQNMNTCILLNEHGISCSYAFAGVESVLGFATQQLWFIKSVGTNSRQRNQQDC